MKKLFILMAFMLSTASFAGDMYLVCETSEGDKFSSNLLVKNETAVVFDEKIQSEKFKFVVTTKLAESGAEFEILRINVSNGGISRNKAQTLDFSDPISVVNDIECRIAD